VFDWRELQRLPVIVEQQVNVESKYPPCRLLAQSGHPDRVGECPLSGAKRTSKFKSVTQAQQSGAVRRMGILMAYAENDPEAQDLIESFQRALQELGWKHGANSRSSTDGRRAISSECRISRGTSSGSSLI